jgi:GGDEF domain-containing protein/CheY-like chemotaxis protein
VVIDADPTRRRTARIMLERDGIHVVEAVSLGDARALVHDAPSALVLDCHVHDGTVADLLHEARDAWPGAAIVLFSDTGDGPDSVVCLRRGDFAALLTALDMATQHRSTRLRIADLVSEESDLIVDEWQQLCRWDPELPPGARPAIAPAVVGALVAALARPQPLGWGTDPEVEKVSEVFALAAGPLDAAIEQLVCLREAVWRRVAANIPRNELVESQSRLQMVIDRAIGVVAHRAASRLEQQALVDPLTGLPNRRAVIGDVRAELNRASRHTRPVSLVIIEIEGFEDVEQREGTASSEGWLRSLAGNLLDAVRGCDTAYRIGASRFALLLPETEHDVVERVLHRIATSGAPRFMAGWATFPRDGEDADDLLAIAEDRTGPVATAI